MPTPAEILGYAPGAGYLAANAQNKGVLFNNGSRLNPLLPQQIYALYFIIQRIYDEDPTYTGLYETSQYLWEIMGRYGIQAQGLSGGGSVPGPTQVQNYPIYITQANFTTATLYPNTNLFGTNISVFLSQLNRLLLPNTEFTVDATGLTILVGSFDALNNDYELLIEKVYT